ncbi:hypothetical protein [Thermithiobacillus plumbiphilus]|uniref:Rubredoxin-like domain-containing protein n=1 Tax=Thermithiobacillus plumbiphilus TaxID=1729899 RepID=A0ABU9DBS9_9PROT
MTTRKSTPKLRGEKFTAPKYEQVRYPFETMPATSEVQGSRTQIERGSGDLAHFAAGEPAPWQGIYTCSFCEEPLGVEADGVIQQCPSCGRADVEFTYSGQRE